MKKQKHIRCPHIKDKPRTWYAYQLCEGVDIHLCIQCNCKLAEEILKQMAIKTFLLNGK